MSNQNFVHLHVHTEYSYLDTAVKLSDLIPFLKENGFPACAITDHGNIDGCLRFYNVCKEAGIKPIIGCELYAVKDQTKKEKGEKRYHMTVLCKNKKGFENLCTILTKANLDGYFHKPRVNFDDVLEYGDGLIVLSGCSSSFLYIYPEYVEKFKERFGDDFYLEVMPIENDFTGGGANDWYYFDLLRSIRDWHRKYRIKLVLTNDVHYIRDEDEIVQQVAAAIRDNKKWNDPTRHKFQVKELSVKTREQMKEKTIRQGIFSEKEIESALDNTIEIANKVEFEMQKATPELPLPDEFADKDKDEHEQLREICYESLKRKGLDKNEIYVKRLEKELSSIIPNFTRYFLIIYDLIHWAKNNGIFTGPGRGSVAGSLAAYLLEITLVDPLKYDLVFERFISEGRIDLPDVDMDFEDRKRDEIFKYLQKKYGEYNVAKVSSFSQMKGKQVIRDIGRIFEIPISRVVEVSKVIVSRSGGDSRANLTITDAFSVFDTGKKFMKDYPEYAKYAMKLEGVIRQTGVHAAGIVISSRDLRFSGNCVLKRDEDGNLLVNWDKRDLEFFGLVKYDVLGLSTLSVLKDAALFIERSNGVKIDYNKMIEDMSDKNVYKMLSSGDTFGVFQLGSLGLSTFCKKIGVEDFRSICDLSALHRPSGLRSGIITSYELRKKGKEKISYAHPILEPILKSTYGLPFYQEQVMYMLNGLAGMPWRTVDYVRKVISKSQGVEQIMKFKEQFVQGCKNKGVLSEKEAERVFEELKHFGAYGFNKSHCVCYSILSYLTAWLKYYYPLEYFCAYLINAGDEEICLKELSKRNIPYYFPDVNVSDYTWSIKDNKLYCGLTGIKGIGVSQASKIIEERERGGLFKSLQDFKARTKIGASVLKNLVKAGALDSIITDSEYAQIVKDIKTDVSSISLFSGEKDSNTDCVRVDASERRKYQKELIPFSSYNDVFGEQQELVEFIKSKITITPLKNLDFNHRNMEERFAIGRIENIKYGYRVSVREGGKGTADDLGGIYSNFKDSEAFTMIVFPHDFYRRDPELVENIAGKSFVVKFFQPYARNNIFVRELWTLDDISCGKIKGLGLNLMEPVTEDILNSPLLGEILSNVNCKLCPGSGRYIPIEIGKYRVMIAGEAPGKSEDEEGIAFVGSAGKLLWSKLKEYGLDRSMFCISNYIKCRPPDNKIKDLRKAKMCFERNLKKEIEMIQPTVILVLGSTAAKVFTDKKITEVTGTVAWNSYYKSFIVYCLHPASVLYHRENMKMFEDSLENFVRLLCGENPKEVETMQIDNVEDIKDIEEEW